MHDNDQAFAPARWKDDVALVARAAAGEPAAFRAIVRTHNRLLFRTARGIVQDDEAQDVVQETYLLAFTHLDSYRGEAALGTWLARIAINVALGTQRRRGRLAPLAEPGDDGEPESAMIPAPERDRPDVQAGSGELRARALLRERLSSRVEGGARDTFAFAGARCDAVLAHVMAGLARLGLLRDE